MGGKLKGAQPTRRDDLAQVVDEMLYWPGQHDDQSKVYMAGSYRRGHEVVGDLDVIIANPRWQEAEFVRQILAGFGLDVSDQLRYLTKGKTTRKMVNFIALVGGETLRYVWPNGESGCQVDLYFCGIEHIGPMMMFLTGSMEYNIWHRGKAKWHGEGFKLTQFELRPVLLWKDAKRKKPDLLGDPISCPDEFDVCQAIGIGWISPKARDAGHRRLWR